MKKYRISKVAKNDLIRIHHYGYEKFGLKQANKYLSNIFKCFDRITLRPFSFEAVDYIKKGYRRCVCGVDVVYFRIINKKVEIICIIGKQNIENFI